MAYYKYEGLWYVVGDANPYNFEEDASAADEQFHTNPTQYITGADPQYAVPSAVHRAPFAGRIGGGGSMRRWTEWRIAGTVIGVALMLAGFAHWYLCDVELMAFFVIYMGMQLLVAAVPPDADVWVDQHGNMYTKGLHTPPTQH